MLVNLNDYITSSNYFKWSEALFLNSLNCYHSPSQEEVDNIIKTCNKLDRFRKYVNKPLKVNCWIRPNSVNDETGKNTGIDYNKLIGGAKLSSHIKRFSSRFSYSRTRSGPINEVNFSQT